eukprot:GGOE01045792.1.p1 GENE.GGOE01045792.1~~GGOE01045792.1.p1  ORF type:complete len:473 (+),score=209.78 GGOE01045792.1:743-2161(+)
MQDLQVAHKAAGEEVEQLQHAATDLQQQLQEAVAKLEEKALRVHDLEMATAILQATTEQQQRQFEKSYTELKENRDVTLQDIKLARDMVVRAARDEQERERAKFQEHTQQLEAQSQEVEQQTRHEIQRLVSEHHQALHDAEALHHDELRVERQERQLEREEHQQALAQMQKQHASELLKLQQTYAADLDRAKSQAHSNLMTAKDRHEEAMAQLRSHFEAIVEEKESEFRAKDFSLQQALEECEQTRRDADMELQRLRHSHHVEVERLKQQEIKMLHDMEMLRLQHSHALDDSAKVISKLEEMEVLKKANEAVLARQKEEQLADALEEKRRRVLEHEVELRRRSDEMRALKEAHELSLGLLRDDHSKRLKEAHADYETRLARAVETEGQKCEDLRRALRQLEEDLRAQHLEEQQRYVGTQLETMREAMLQRVAADKEELLKAHAEATDAFAAAWQQWVQQRSKKGQGCACIIC